MSEKEPQLPDVASQLLDAVNDRQSRPWFGWLSLLFSALPALFLAILLFGGGRSGFGAWNDVRDFLVLMAGSAVLGLVCFALSFKRQEQTVAAYLALLIHLVYLIYVLWAFQQ